MITENITRDVAEAQVSDDCQVELWVGELRKNRIATLTPTQAHILAAELVAAAERADDAAEERRHEHEPAAFDLLNKEGSGGSAPVGDLVEPLLKASHRDDQGTDRRPDAESVCPVARFQQSLDRVTTDRGVLRHLVVQLGQQFVQGLFRFSHSRTLSGVTR